MCSHVFERLFLICSLERNKKQASYQKREAIEQYRETERRLTTHDERVYQRLTDCLQRETIARWDHIELKKLNRTVVRLRHLAISTVGVDTVRWTFFVLSVD